MTDQSVRKSELTFACPCGCGKAYRLRRTGGVVRQFAEGPGGGGTQDPLKHPHRPSGSREGGQFAPTGSRGNSGAPAEKPPALGKPATMLAEPDKSKFVGQTVGKAEHVRATQIEQGVAKHVGGKWLEDNEPLDVRVQGQGGAQHAIEVKSLLKGSKQSITVHDDALARKVDYAAANPGVVYHTVAVDDRAKYEGGAHAENYSGNTTYYKRGSGRYSLSQMHPVSGPAELKALVAAPDSKLPAAARGSLPSDGEAEALKARAVKAHASRLTKDRARKARIKVAKAQGE